jgi:tetratricopeptide (TPR) repeat protein/transglutaminase-like putative cysteine protease
VHLPSSLRQLIGLFLLFFAAHLGATDVWSRPAFSVDAATLSQAAQSVKPEKHTDATVLLDDLGFSFDQSGRLAEDRHLIYRIETQPGVEDWAEASGQWEAWHHVRPEIKARVITADGAEHWLDSKTLTDVPAHENEPELYSDVHKLGGPLPAVSIGAIVELEVVIRETAPLFAGGVVHSWALQWSVPVENTHIVITHPDAIPVQYRLHLLPEAKVTKASQNGMETITLDQGRLAANTEVVEYVPPDVVTYPSFEFSTGTSWQRVAAEYARLSEDKLRSFDAQSELAKINLKDRSRNQKIRQIVAALHKNVRYTGVEFGESSLVPQPPSETLKRKYGDCKDTSLLLVAMLRGAGIPAHLALLDSGPGQDLDPELPGMGKFDHAIVYIPASGSEPELWVDATAQYTQVGTLPWMDYNRWALVVDENTERLQQTPKLAVAQNVHHELREFTLADFGPAAIVETDEQTGPGEADYRSYYSTDSKKLREESETYVKSAYLADSLIALEHGDLADMEKPVAIRYVTKGKRGSTDLTTAVTAIRIEDLFGSLPKYFKSKEEEKKAEGEDSEKPKERTIDWQINPFTTEWRYKITAPLGFKLRALPSDKNEKIETLNFTQKYSVNSEGTVVEAVLRVENTQTRLTVEQAKTLRDAVVRVCNSDPIMITFDHTGHWLISAGKIKEGLAAYREIAAQHPQGAIHKVRLAEALLTVGLGEEARSAAQEATKLDPKSALANSNLGMVLKHDLVGRLLKKGMDYSGAVAAYRQAIVLDPKDKETRANLALLLEYDAGGTRYSEDAPLKEAVAELRELKKLDEDYSRTYDDNVLYDLWYAHDYQGVLDYAATLPSSDVRKGLVLAAITQTEGVDAALKKSLQITTDDQGRSKALAAAAQALFRVRRYTEAAAFSEEAAKGQGDESGLTRRAAILKKTKPYDEGKLDPADPRSVVQQVYAGLLSRSLSFEKFKSLTYGSISSSDEPMEKQFRQVMAKMGTIGGSTGVPAIAMTDLVISNMHFTADGDDATGYKIITEPLGAPPETVYVIRDSGRYKVLAFSFSNMASPEPLASLVLEDIEKNNLAAARKWLDRARETIHQSGGDDPLSGPSFPFFWTIGQEAEATAIRTAALVLLPSRKLEGSYLDALNEARQSAKTDTERNRLTMVLAYAYSAQERWAEMLPLTQELTKSFPDSIRAFELEVTALKGLKRFDDCEALIQARIKEHPDELAYVRDLSELAISRRQFDKARQIIKGIIDKGQGTANDMNLYAWYALFLPGPIDQETIDVALRATDQRKNSFAILHTLACVYAQAGQPVEARSTLLKAMDALNLEEPNSEVWFGFGLIAEQYGMPEAAKKMFERVDKPKGDYPGATSNLAQQHLAALQGLKKGTSNHSGQ